MMEQHFSYFNSQLNYSFHCSVLLEENHLPTLESILEMQQNKDCYFLFCDNFHSRIVGFTFWRDNCTKQKISEMAMVLDEAFAYLLIENYWDEWSTKIWMITWVRDLTIVQSAKGKRRATWGKYTKGAWGAWHYAGWNQDGIF